jgi:hypothetical protein
VSAVTTNGVHTEARPHSTATYESSHKGAGWVMFASVMFVVAGALNIIWGIAAVSNSHFFAGHAAFILSELNTWGWIAIGFGAVQLLAAVSIWRGGEFGHWFGLVVAALATILAMMMIPAYPFWSLVLVAIDILVIYGLVAYGGRPELTR